MMTADVHFYCVTPVSDLGMQYIWTTRLYVSEPQCHWVKYLRRTTMHEDNKPSTTKWFRHQSFLPYCHLFVYVNQRRKLFFWTVNERIPDISKRDVHAYTPHCSRQTLRRCTNVGWPVIESEHSSFWTRLCWCIGPCSSCLRHALPLT